MMPATAAAHSATASDTRNTPPAGAIARERQRAAGQDLGVADREPREAGEHVAAQPLGKREAAAAATRRAPVAARVVRTATQPASAGHSARYATKPAVAMTATGAGMPPNVSSAM